MLNAKLTKNDNQIVFEKFAQNLYIYTGTQIF